MQSRAVHLQKDRHETGLLNLFVHVLSHNQERQLIFHSVIYLIIFMARAVLAHLRWLLELKDLKHADTKPDSRTATAIQTDADNHIGSMNRHDVL